MLKEGKKENKKKNKERKKERKQQIKIGEKKALPKLGLKFRRK